MISDAYLYASFYFFVFSAVNCPARLDRKIFPYYYKCKNMERGYEAWIMLNLDV